MERGRERERYWWGVGGVGSAVDVGCTVWCAFHPCVFGFLVSSLRPNRMVSDIDIAGIAKCAERKRRHTSLIFRCFLTSCPANYMLLQARPTTHSSPSRPTSACHFVIRFFHKYSLTQTAERSRMWTRVGCKRGLSLYARDGRYQSN